MSDSEFEAKLYDQRLDTLKKIADLGFEIYPNHFEVRPPGITIPKLREEYVKPGHEWTAEQFEATPVTVAIAGRLMQIRIQGKAGFAQLQQGGQRLQIYVRKDAVGDTQFELYKLLDLGDHIGVEGYLFITRTGETTVHVTKLTFLAKAMYALPDKYHGLEDVELRYRQRYVDLFMNTGASAKQAEQVASAPLIPESQPGMSGIPTPTQPQSGPHVTEGPPNVREVFVKRAKVVRALRKFFDERDYIEVETPMMHPVAGGATARPFVTKHNALDMELYLRIAPELYLKRLVVGGLDRVYEINRNFRNEGVSTQHNPEFTMLEFYQAYSNYHDLMDLTEELIKFVALEVNGTTISTFNGVEIDLGKWTKLSMKDAIVKFWPIEFGPAPSVAAFETSQSFEKFIYGALLHLNEQYPKINTPTADVEGVDIDRHRRLRSLHMLINAQLLLIRPDYGPIAKILAEAFGIAEAVLPAKSPQSLGRTIAGVFEAVAEPHLIQPTIIYDFPLAVSPLSKIKPDEPEWVERFEFYIGGFEVGNAFSELNDPVDQRRRFEAQVAEKARGDDEAMEMDEDYVRALGYGLPPTAGEGIGIDRLTMILTGSRSIRDVILFPLMRTQAKPAE